jgi:hypothetical protein
LRNAMKQLGTVAQGKKVGRRNAFGVFVLLRGVFVLQCATTLGCLCRCAGYSRFSAQRFRGVCAVAQGIRVSVRNAFGEY